VDGSALLATTHMSNRCSSNRSTSSNRCDELSASNLNILNRGMEWVVVDRLRGRVCMTMCRSQMSQRTEAVVVDSKVERAVEVVEDLRLQRLIPQRHRRQMLLLDRRMLVNLVRIIVAVVEVVNEASIRMLEDKSSELGFTL
jgi:hypothetical protein